MTDRELIEAAAKAAKIEVLYCSDGFRLSEKGVATHKWDPLNSEADAFRLAVKLGLRDYFWVEVQNTCVQTCYVLPQEDVFYESFKDQDPCAATRRAIVRAAAELGKQT